MTNIVFVDNNDRVIGVGSKQEAWKKGIVHRIVRVFIFNSKGELLIQKRADTIESLPGKWDQSAAGHVDEGEDYPIAARRELVEEVGISGIELKEFSKFFTDEKDENQRIKKRFNMIYTGTYDGEIKPDPEEVSKVMWIDPKKLEVWMNESPEEFTNGFLKSFKNLQSKKI